MAKKKPAKNVAKKAAKKSPKKVPPGPAFLKTFKETSTSMTASVVTARQLESPADGLEFAAAATATVVNVEVTVKNHTGQRVVNVLVAAIDSQAHAQRDVSFASIENGSQAVQTVTLPNGCDEAHLAYGVANPSDPLIRHEHIASTTGPKKKVVFDLKP